MWRCFIEIFDVQRVVVPICVPTYTVARLFHGVFFLYRRLWLQLHGKIGIQKGGRGRIREYQMRLTQCLIHLRFWRKKEVSWAGMAHPGKENWQRCLLGTEGGIICRSSYPFPPTMRSTLSLLSLSLQVDDVVLPWLASWRVYQMIVTIKRRWSVAWEDACYVICPDSQCASRSKCIISLHDEGSIIRNECFAFIFGLKAYDASYVNAGQFFVKYIFIAILNS